MRSGGGRGGLRAKKKGPQGWSKIARLTDRVRVKDKHVAAFRHVLPRRRDGGPVRFPLRRRHEAREEEGLARARRPHKAHHLRRGKGG